MFGPDSADPCLNRGGLCRLSGLFQHYSSDLSRLPVAPRLSQLPWPTPPMEVSMHSIKTPFRPALAALLLVLVLAGPTRADVIADWNAKAESIAIEKRMLPAPNARGMAML